MQHQIRECRITPGAMSEFVAEWEAAVVPLRLQAKFEIVGAWSSPETNRFVWIVSHAGDGAHMVTLR